MSGTQTTVANNLDSFISAIMNTGVTDIRMGIMEYYDNTYNIKDFSGSKWTNSIDDIKNKILELASSNWGGTENALTALNKVLDEYDFRDGENGAKNKHIVLITDEDSDDYDFDTSLLEATKQKLKDNGVILHGVYDVKGYDVTEFNELVDSTSGEKVDLYSSNWGEELVSIIGGNIGETSGGIKIKNEPLVINIQDGPNSNDIFEIRLTDARTTNLGVHSIVIDLLEKAKEALKNIDKAIEFVSNERIRFGSYQNRLETDMSNISNYDYNLTSANSRITDLDVAKGVLEFAKTNILMNVNNSILVQANQMPQGVLQLLR